MANNRAFAYNPSHITVPGTINVGDLCVGHPTVPFEDTGLIWWGGPDEDLGYVIAYSQPDGLHPTPIDITASLGFKRTPNNDSAFVNFVNKYYSAGANTAAQAVTWLNDNGYWTSYSGFGSSGFQWMTINSVTPTTASGIGQNSITVEITQSGGGMEPHTGMYSADAFPEQYGVPPTGTQILNQAAGTFTAVFSQPVQDPLVAFASVGQPGLQVPVISSAPFTPIWGTATTYQDPASPTQFNRFTGEEGFNIIRIDGLIDTVTFNYTVSEYYCTVCFGFIDQN
jgi:hypothetical protein